MLCFCVLQVFQLKSSLIVVTANGSTYLVLQCVSLFRVLCLKLSLHSPSFSSLQRLLLQRGQPDEGRVPAAADGLGGMAARGPHRLLPAHADALHRHFDDRPGCERLRRRRSQRWRQGKKERKTTLVFFLEILSTSCQNIPSKQYIPPRSFYNEHAITDNFTGYISEVSWNI